MKWAFFIFTGVYVAALALLAIGTFGLFEQDRDPLSGVFLLPLGMPWNFLADWLGISGMATALVAPAINAAVLFWLWRR
ncbi:hypothetical protein [Erythrobacter sp. F6033]|uniref:hypothetical protein n=1 Tax=Erythrobacter sp. F6033 TaxID=2926401 RepID=UPI001FF1AA5D|nr:hypothetical protein [Erythrobacter sp. F6033]MCK0129108.1 hypothetical protein [Erythrobacter sp. F6033]